MTGSAARHLMLLIDADNVSSDVIEQAIAQTLNRFGAAHLRRAYCNAETAVKQQALFKRLGIRPMVNLAAGKNSTDIALAADAVDLVITERPDVVVLVSSDSDFAPLVLRLREKGCRVCGIGQEGKTGEETMSVYDEFLNLTHRGAAKAGAPAPAKKAAARPAAKVAGATKKAPAAAKTAAKTAANTLPKTETEAAEPPAAKSAARSASTKTASARPAASRSAAAADAPGILAAVPALRDGAEVPLNDVAKALRTAGLLSKNGSSIKLFEKLPAEFEVRHHPDRIRWTGAR